MQNVKIMKFKKYTRMTIENYVYKGKQSMYHAAFKIELYQVYCWYLIINVVQFLSLNIKIIIGAKKFKAGYWGNIWLTVNDKKVVYGL